MNPFTPLKQQQLINVFVDATSGNLSASQFTVLLVSSAFSSRHRSLLQAPIVVRCTKRNPFHLAMSPSQYSAVPLQNRAAWNGCLATMQADNVLGSQYIGGWPCLLSLAATALGGVASVLLSPVHTVQLQQVAACQNVKAFKMPP